MSDIRELARNVTRIAEQLQAVANEAEEAGLVVDIEVNHVDVTTMTDQHSRKRTAVRALVTHILSGS